MNKIKKQKTALLVITILAMVLGLAGIGGGLALTITKIIKICGGNLKTGTLVASIILAVLGVILVVGGGIAFVFGIYWTFVGSAVKATNGSIAEENLSKGTVNGKVCPKCGCTNTPDSLKCTSCGQDL